MPTEPLNHPNTTMSQPESIPEDREQDPETEREEYYRHMFIDSYNTLSSAVHATAEDKGWWDTDKNNGEALALIHSEVSEALEALRAGNPPDDKIPEFSGVEAELADVIIRIMDLGCARNWDIARALVAKMAMNKGRARMHGGKQF